MKTLTRKDLLTILLRRTVALEHVAESIALSQVEDPPRARNALADGPDAMMLRVMLAGEMPNISVLHSLAAKWRAQNGDYPESKRDCADELLALVETKSPMHCLQCQSPLLWSEDRGLHCDECEDQDCRTNLPDALAEIRQDVALFIDEEETEDRRDAIGRAPVVTDMTRRSKLHDVLRKLDALLEEQNQ